MTFDGLFFLKIPAFFRLMRFNRPIGILLLLWPTLAALFLANNGKPPIKTLWIFLLGVVVMRAAGCVINDLCDKNFDGAVNRTKLRPLVTGQLSMLEAWGCLFILCSLAFVLVWQLGWALTQWAAGGLILALAYPLTKRFFSAPQFWLGFTFNWGILMAFALNSPKNFFSALIFYLAGVAWTIAYDTQYAMVDRADDIKIGIHSTAIGWGRHDRILIGIFQILAWFLWGLVGRLQHLGAWFYLLWALVPGFFIYQQVISASREPQACFTAFTNNQWVGLLLFLAVVLGILL